MNGLFIASYVLLWLVVVALAVLLIGALRQIGSLRLETGHFTDVEDDPIPTVQEDGPPIGSRLPALTQGAVGGNGSMPAPPMNASTLLVFMSPMCESCQHVVDPINELLGDRSDSLRATVLLRADDQGCSAFLSVFPLQAQVICDSNHDLTGALGVHRNPFGLLYDEGGILVRKGVIKNRDELRALLGDPTATPEAAEAVYPPLELSTDREDLALNRRA
jgi:methylamine dehydrogenase accessory protein MauD